MKRQRMRAGIESECVKWNPESGEFVEFVRREDPSAAGMRD